MAISLLPDLRAARKKPLGSSTSVMAPSLTHKVIHRKCAELCALDRWAWPGREIARRLPCRIFAHGNKVIVNQGFSMPCVALRTILSTKNVQNLCADGILSTETILRPPLIVLPFFYARY